MEWTESIRRAIDYMETHILEDITVEEVAESVHISPFYQGIHSLQSSGMKLQKNTGI